MRQSELQYKVELFVTNGKLEEAQEVLAKIGYGLDRLNFLAAKLHTWNEYRHRAKTLAREKEQAAEARAKAGEAAHMAAIGFQSTARRVFKGNKPVLTELGLYPALWRKRGNGATNGTTPEQRNGAAVDQTGSAQTNRRYYSQRPSESTAAVFDRRRMLFGKGQDLAEADQARLAERGWPVEAIIEGANLVEAHAMADIIYIQKEQAHAAAVSAASAAAIELEKLYIEARGYARDALAGLPAKKRARLKRLLGL